jgi:hypothetical protein
VPVVIRDALVLLEKERKKEEEEEERDGLAALTRGVTTGGLRNTCNPTG